MIRPATRADLPDLHRMLTALAVHNGDTVSLTQPRLSEMLFGARRAITALIAEKDGNPVGYAALARTVRLQTGQEGQEILHLFVDPDHRGQGIGRALIAAARGRAAARGQDYIVIGAMPENHAAQEAYAAMGLTPGRPSGPRYWARAS